MIVNNSMPGDSNTNMNKTTCMEVLWIDVNRKSFQAPRSEAESGAAAAGDTPTRRARHADLHARRAGAGVI